MNGRWISATYVTFDKPTQMAAASSAPEMLLSAYEFFPATQSGITLIDAMKHGTFPEGLGDLCMIQLFRDIYWEGSSALW